MMTGKEILALRARLDGAREEISAVFAAVVGDMANVADELVKLKIKDAARSEAFDNLTKGDAETMLVTPDERKLVEGVRSGEYKLARFARVNETGDNEILTAIVAALDFITGGASEANGTADDCPCPGCTARRKREAGVKASLN